MVYQQFQNVSKFFPATKWNVFVTADSLTDLDIIGLQKGVDAFVTCSYGEVLVLGYLKVYLFVSVVCPFRHSKISCPVITRISCQLIGLIFGIPDPALVYPISARWGVPKEGSLAPVLNNLIYDIKNGIVKYHLDKAISYYKNINNPLF